MKSLVAALVVGCLLVAIPGQAKRGESIDECTSGCSGNLDVPCWSRCANLITACNECCHIKLPGATKEHCQNSCKRNLTSYRCPSR